MADENPASPGGSGFAGFFGFYLLLFIAIVIVAIALGLYWLAVVVAIATALLALWMRRALRRSVSVHADGVRDLRPAAAERLPTKAGEPRRRVRRTRRA
jgi:membrane protein implicated in regulation of membrane protease activity